jgi:hypothetical protein
MFAINSCSHVNGVRWSKMRIFLSHWDASDELLFRAMSMQASQLSWICVIQSSSGHATRLHCGTGFSPGSLAASCGVKCGDILKVFNVRHTVFLGPGAGFSNVVVDLQMMSRDGRSSDSADMHLCTLR